MIQLLHAIQISLSIKWTTILGSQYCTRGYFGFIREIKYFDISQYWYTVFRLSLFIYIYIYFLGITFFLSKIFFGLKKNQLIYYSLFKE